MVTTPTDTLMGEATARSGWPAFVEWSGLTEGETYAWYVVSRDADTGDNLAPVRSTRRVSSPQPQPVPTTSPRADRPRARDHHRW